jgi:hypothetical protein
MSRKASRMAALAGTLAAVGAMSVATTSASAFTLTVHFKNLAVSGTLTPKKLNQPVTLPEGSVFNGQSALEIPPWSGPITGSVFVPPFNATIPVLGIPTTVGLTFTEVGNVNGAIVGNPSGGCPWADPSLICLTMNVPTSANIGITEVGVLGINTPTHCETSEPLTLNFSTTLTLAELLTVGPHFTGTTTIPPIKCDGLEGIAVGLALTAVMSGPDNPYAINLAAPYFGR